MPREAAGRAAGLLSTLDQGAGDGFDLRACDAARAQQDQVSVEDSDHRGLQADAAGAALEGHGGADAGFFDSIREGGGAGPARAVGRGGRDRATEPLKHRLGYQMIGGPHRDRVEPRPRKIAYGGRVARRRHQGQRPRPERAGQVQGARVQRRDADGGVEAGHVGDHRIEARAALGGEDAGDGLRIAGVAREAIDGLCGQDDEPALAQGLDRPVDRCVVRAAVGRTAQDWLPGRTPGL